jgi:hypothetical protein
VVREFPLSEFLTEKLKLPSMSGKSLEMSVLGWEIKTFQYEV